MAKVKLSKLQKAYREFFKAMMDEFGVKSPVELKDKRSEFFNRIKKEWPTAKKKIKEGVLRQEIRDIIVETLNENMLNEKKLPSEDKSKGNVVLKAAKKYFKKSKGINTSFEHGHWWITLDDGSQYDVVDAEGSDTIGGFDFEMVSESD